MSQRVQPEETQMKLAHLIIAPTLVVCWLLAGGCTIDDRRVTVISGLGSGGTQAANESGVTGTGGGPASLPDAMVAAPRLAVSTEAIDLGWVATGFPSRARVRLDNLGTAPLPAPSVTFAAGSHADFSLIQNDCARDVAPGESCELRVQLVPSESGERAATLEIRSESGDAQVALVGSGLVAGALTLAPVAGNFEDFGAARVGSTLEETFSIFNPSDVVTGPLRFRVNRPEFALLAPGEGGCVADQTSLVGGTSCTLSVAFTPSERGPLEATLTGTSDTAGAVSVTLVGRGLLPAALRASAQAVDFSGVVLSSSARRSVRFENAGDEPLTLAGARLLPEGAEGFAIVNSDCVEGAQLEGGRFCSVQLEFRPPRVGEELTAELFIGSGAEDAAQTVALRGVGLEQGALTVSALAPGDDDFGDVLLGGTSSERRFQIQNPSAQPSGVLEFATSEGFVVAAPSSGAAGECTAGSTSLVDGEACTVRVLFAPASRETFTGSLTVSSALAGAAAMPLRGRGIKPAVLELTRELNFGRVLTGASGVRSIAIANAGDQPLPPPRFELTGNSPDQVSAFSFESQCSAPLAVGEACDVHLTFAPTEATAHAVTLSVSSAGGDANVLLLGEAQVPGSLVLEAADGSSEFGDVPLGTTATRSFSLSNPGPTPSGRLTISSDNNRFEVDLGDCDPADSQGLVEGSSCTVGVRFTPADNRPQVANLSVQSPGSGRAGLQLSGRGRQLGVLSATGNRDLGRANVAEDALTQPENEFTWTIDNQGDLPTGTLAVENDNGAEFVIRDDSCSGSSVAGGASCQMIIRFRPSAAGNRVARVVVSDAGGGRPATLALTGLGVQLAGLGESCVNAECAAGVCTRGVCCDRACDRTCQACSAEGQCLDQENQEACGNGAACFGVDNCKLPAGLACSQNGGDAQCGSGNCERRLGGSGAGDRICCLDDCGDALDCNASNRCSECTTGQRRCNAGSPQQCNAGFWQDSAPCPGNLACIDDGACGCAGDTPRQCSAELCVAEGQCCQDTDCGNACQACNTTSHVCGALGNRPDRCPGSQQCNAQLQCVDCNDGDTRCVQGAREQCNNGVWQDASCPGTLQCQGQGACGCNAGTACNSQCVNTAEDENNCGQCGSVCAGTCVSGVCRAPDGATCTGNVDCAGGLCQAWAFDRDNDGFGVQSTLLRICGAAPPSNQPGGAGVWRQVNEGVPVNQRFDCCDTDADVSPSQLNFREGARSGCAGPPGDFNCDGREDLRFEGLSGEPRDVLSGFEACEDLGTNCDSGPLIWIGGEPPPCGTPRGEAGASQCFVVDGVCQSVVGTGIVIFCL